MIRKKIPYFLLFFATFITYAQNNINVNTDISRTRVYENYVSEGYGSPKVYTELANAYYFKNDFAKAKFWYDKLFESTKIRDNTLIFRYKQTLKAIESKKIVASN